jgi:hypothetical protein
MPLRTFNTIPPGGWVLEQALPSGGVKKWKSMNEVGKLAKEIADFRKGNELARATVHEVIADIEAATCLRLHDDPNYCAPAQKKTVRAAVAHPSSSVRAAVASGKRVLVDWLGSGAKPVAIAIAQRRADTCLKCEKNKEGHRFLRLTAEVARVIAEQMQAKGALKLRVAGEEGLHACEVCACPLPLKIHVPLATILKHTDDETLAAFPPHCWITTERQTI